MANPMTTVQTALTDLLDNMTTETGDAFYGVYAARPNLDDLVGHIVAWVEPGPIDEINRRVGGAKVGFAGTAVVPWVWFVRAAIWRNNNTTAGVAAFAAQRNDFAVAMLQMLVDWRQLGITAALDGFRIADMPIFGPSFREDDTTRAGDTLFAMIEFEVRPRQDFAYVHRG